MLPISLIMFINIQFCFMLSQFYLPHLYGIVDQLGWGPHSYFRAVEEDSRTQIGYATNGMN